MALKKLTAGEGGPGNFEIPPAGTHLACVVAVIDLGTQQKTYPGQPSKWASEILIAWELSEEEDSQGERFVVGKSFTYSANPKAALRIMMEAFRGAKYKEGDPIDPTKLLGQACQVMITHDERGEGKTYANWAGVAALPKKMVAPKPIREPFFQAIEDNYALPDWLPRIYGKKVEEVIAVSQERSGKYPTEATPAPANGKVTHHSGNGSDYSPKGPTSTQGALDLKSSDLPF